MYEFEAKALLADYHVPVPSFRVVTHAVGAARAGEELGPEVVVKAQVLSGGRMKAGGVLFASGSEETAAAAAGLLGARICNLQVDRVLVEPRIQIPVEYFVAVTYDTQAQTPVLLASRHGGIHVEAQAGSADGWVRMEMSPIRPLWAYGCREAAAALGVQGRHLVSLATVMQRLYTLFRECDATLVEVNPLVLTGDGTWLALDGHIALDDEALYRQTALVKRFALAGRAQGARPPTALEQQAAEIDALDHRGVAGRVVEFDGEVALLIGGGGASLTVFDAIRAAGGRPANYCEVGGNPTVRKVAALTRLLLGKPGVRRIAVIMNIVSNTRADLMARGVIQGVMDAGKDPAATIAVFRVPGAWEAESALILDHYGIRYCDRNTSIDEAARLAVAG